MEANAIFSRDKKYRYLLKKTWDASLPAMMFIGLNPSNMDAGQSNPTLKRCVAFAKRWCYGALYVANLYAYIDTHRGDIWSGAHDPVGAENDQIILDCAARVEMVLLGWGNHAQPERVAAVYQLLSEQGIQMHCLKVNKTGTPAHPLYQKSDVLPIPYVMTV